MKREVEVGWTMRGIRSGIAFAAVAALVLAVGFVTPSPALAGTDRHIIVITHVINNQGGTAVASDFTMTINGVACISSICSFPGEESPGVNRDAINGDYFVTQSGPSNYVTTFSGDCTGTIDGPGDKTCVVTNDDFGDLTIDIKPSNRINTISLKKDANIPVAVLGSDIVNVQQIQVSSLKFGDICEDGALDTGASAIGNTATYKDINHDGYLDMTAKFSTQQTGIDPGDSDACLRGNLTPSFGSLEVEGHDFIRTAK